VGQRAGHLVAEQSSRLVAAAHLLRYVPDERAGPCYRGLGEISWFLFWPHVAAGNPSWPGASPAGDQLMSACLELMRRWGTARQAAGGNLPLPGVYGVPDPWPHVSAAYERAGFAHTGHTEVIYLARVGDLPRPGATALAGMTVRRSVGLNGTRLAAVRDDAEIGYIEVEASYDQERRPRLGGWAEVGGLSVEPPFRRQGVATWLLGQAAEWLGRAGVDRILDYAWLDGTDPGGLDYAGYRAFLPTAGFRELARTRLGWTRSLEDAPEAREARS
jgi:GNAT superfamily N-acetyltransferase